MSDTTTNPAQADKHKNTSAQPHYNVPLQYVRSALYSFIALPVWTLFLTIIGVPMMLAPRPIFMHYIVKVWAYGVSFMERHILNLHYEVRGLEHFPKDGRCIVAAKHQSTYETFKIHEIFTDYSIILKRELFLVPFWGQFLWKSDVIGINRSSPKTAMASIIAGIKRMKAEGRTVIIYPQGTRVTPQTRAAQEPYKYGVFKMHEATDLPVIPLATNSGCFWPKGRLLKTPGTVIFEFMPAVISHKDKQVMMADLQERLEVYSDALAAESGYV